MIFINLVRVPEEWLNKVNKRQPNSLRTWTIFDMMMSYVGCARSAFCGWRYKRSHPLRVWYHWSMSMYTLKKICQLWWRTSVVSIWCLDFYSGVRFFCKIPRRWVMQWNRAQTPCRPLKSGCLHVCIYNMSFAWKRDSSQHMYKAILFNHPFYPSQSFMNSGKMGTPRRVLHATVYSYVGPKAQY